MPVFAEVEADDFSQMLGTPLSEARMAQDGQSNVVNNNNNTNNSTIINIRNNNSNNTINNPTCYVGLESLPGLFASNDGDGPYNEFYFSETSHALRVLQGKHRVLQSKVGVLQG